MSLEIIILWKDQRNSENKNTGWLSEIFNYTNQIISLSDVPLRVFDFRIKDIRYKMVFEKIETR